MSEARPAAVAGTFYPGREDALRDEVERLLAGAQTDKWETWPKAVIAPHAGYVYSGPIAAAAYARLLPAQGIVERVVLLGPAHFVHVRGIAATGYDAWQTPLGEVPIDVAARDLALSLPGVFVDDAAHAPEHSLEVHLPFLQAVLGVFDLVPFAVGNASPELVAGLLDELWGGDETLIVVSSDLSHYHDYATAQRLDQATAKAIEELVPEAMQPDSACGIFPVRGLLVAARHRGMRLETIDLRNSGDTAGSRDRVVGYGAFVSDVA